MPRPAGLKCWRGPDLGDEALVINDLKRRVGLAASTIEVVSTGSDSSSDEFWLFAPCVLGFRLSEDRLAGRIFDTANLTGHHFVDPIRRRNQRFPDAESALQPVSAIFVAWLARWKMELPGNYGPSQPFAALQARMEEELGAFVSRAGLGDGASMGFSLAWAEQ